MRRPGNATLPCAYLLNCGIPRTLKTRTYDGRSSTHSLSMRSLTVCRVEISPKHKISYNTQQILNDRSHVLYLPTRKRFQANLNGRYDERGEVLKIEVIINSLHKKRVVRSWARRRMDQAVTEALRKRGFGRNGRRLESSDDSTVRRPDSNSSPIDLTTKSTPEALIGTLSVYVLPSSIDTKFTEVQRQAGVVADKVLKTCGYYPRNG